MTPIEALRTAMANVMGSQPELSTWANRILTNLHGFQFKITPMPCSEAGTPIDKLAEMLVEKFATAIMHGDSEHRKWLREAADAFVQGRPIPPARDTNGIMRQTTTQFVATIRHWNKVGVGTPLGPWLETMHQDEYKPATTCSWEVCDCAARGKPCAAAERGVNICRARIILFGDEIEWIDKVGYSTLVNPGSFKAPTHWRWPHSVM